MQSFYFKEKEIDNRVQDSKRYEKKDVFMDILNKDLKKTR